MVKLDSKEKKISEIILLVHPLYYLRDKENLSKIEKLNARLLLGAWGKELKDTAKNPRAIVVFVLPGSSFRHNWFNPLFNPRLKRFVLFAKRMFGDRFFFVDRSIDPEKLSGRISKRGFVFDRKTLAGRSFGEYWNLCVRMQTERIVKTIGFGVESIRPIYDLSLDFHKTNKQSKQRIRKRPNIRRK